MGLTGSLENRSVQTSFSQEELDKFKKICENNNLSSVDDICHYYEKQGVEIDYGCPNLWPIGGPKAKQKEYFECKAAFYENTGTSAGGGGSGSCSSSKNADSASDAQADAAANNQSTNDANSDETANEAQTADAAASEAAAEKANDAVAAAKDLAASAMDAISSKLANMNMIAQGAAALAATALSKIGMFSLPNIEIPEFKLPEINSFIENIKETYNPEAILNADVKTLMDQLGSIEDIRNQLEGTRLGEQLKELAANQKLEDAFLDKLKGLGGAVAAAFDNAGSIDSAISSVMDAAAKAGNIAETVAAAAEAAANGELMSSDAIKSIVDGIKDAAGVDLNSSMKAVFSDLAGKASEALGKADTESGERVRGNGPCGGGTRNVGGVNWNDAEGDEENAQEKAYYLKLFEDACAAGNMDEVERLYDILVNQFGESPELLRESINKLQKTAPQTKAGIARVDAITEIAEKTTSLEDAGETTKEASEHAIAEVQQEIADAGGNVPTFPTLPTPKPEIEVDTRVYNELLDADGNHPQWKQLYLKTYIPADASSFDSNIAQTIRDLAKTKAKAQFLAHEDVNVITVRVYIFNEGSTRIDVPYWTDSFKRNILLRDTSIIGEYSGEPPSSSADVGALGDGKPELLDNTVNANKSLTDSLDEAKRLQAAAEFVNENNNAAAVEQITSGPVVLTGDKRSAALAEYKASLRRDLEKKLAEANDSSKDIEARETAADVADMYQHMLDVPDDRWVVTEDNGKFSFKAN